MIESVGGGKPDEDRGGRRGGGRRGGGREERDEPLFNTAADLDASRVSDAPSRRRRHSGTRPAPLRGVASVASVSSSSFDREQLQNAAIIVQVGTELGASVRDIQIALMAAIVESGLRNLDYGDRDSIGMFQQRDAWGSRSARLDPFKSTRMFFLGGAAGQEGLLDKEDRRSMGMGEAAQAVQVSAFPDRYAEHAAEAATLIKQVAGIDVPAESPGVVEATGSTGTLADVAPLDGIGQHQSPMGEVTSATTEVNGVGEVTADAAGIGSLSFDEAGEALGGLSFDGATSGALSSPSSGTGGSGGSGGGYSGGGGGVGGFPAAGGSVESSYGGDEGGLPTYTYTPTGGQIAGAVDSHGEGEVFRGSYKGKDPYDLTTWDGETVDFLTHAALSAASKEAGTDFHMMQGSHNAGGVAASGGTHDGGGVVDIAPANGDWEGAVTAMRKMGFAAWVRNVPGHGYAGSGAHIHAVLIGNERLSSQAAVQVQSYLNNDDGLVGSRADDSTRAYVGNRFEWGDALAQEREKAVSRSAGFLGTPFAWGGKDYTGIDDFGLARQVYGNLVPSARTVADLVELAEPTPLNETDEGDLLAWGNGKQLGISIGEGLVITTGGPGGAVQVVDLSEIASPIFTVPMANLPTRENTRDPFTPRPVRHYDYSPGEGTPRGFGSSSPDYVSVPPRGGIGSGLPNAGASDDTPRGYGSSTGSSSSSSSSGTRSGSRGGGGRKPRNDDPRIPDFGV